MVSPQTVCSCDETPRPKVTWEESVFLSYTSTSQPITARSQARNSNRAGIRRQELKRPWRSVALFAQFTFLYHLGLPTHGGPTHTVWTPTSITKEMPHRPAFSPILQRHFPRMPSNPLAEATAQVPGFNYASRDQTRSWSRQMHEDMLKIWHFR